MKNQLYIMIGPSGCGKSTWARGQVERSPLSTVIVSTDTIRGGLWGDEGNQQHGDVVFLAAYTQLECLLTQGYNVIFDATNLTPSARRAPCKIARDCGANIVFCVATTSMSECVARQEERARRVPVYIIENQFKKFTGPHYTEDYDGVVYF
jgi:predicted kinase